MNIWLRIFYLIRVANNVACWDIRLKKKHKDKKKERKKERERERKKLAEVEEEEEEEAEEEEEEEEEKKVVTGSSRQPRADSFRFREITSWYSWYNISPNWF